MENISSAQNENKTRKYFAEIVEGGHLDGIEQTVMHSDKEVMAEKPVDVLEQAIITKKSDRILLAIDGRNNKRVVEMDL